MNDATMIALSKLLEKQVDGIDVPVGSTMVDDIVTIHVNGVVSRSRDSEYTPTTSIPLKETMALLLHRMGFQREAASKMIIDAMRDVMNSEVQFDERREIKSLVSDIDEAMEHVKKITQSLPKKTRRGSTTVKGSLEVMSTANEQVLLVA